LASSRKCGTSPLLEHRIRSAGGLQGKGFGSLTGRNELGCMNPQFRVQAKPGDISAFRRAVKSLATIIVNKLEL
jgi:hypothetical protein